MNSLNVVARLLKKISGNFFEINEFLFVYKTERQKAGGETAEIPIHKIQELKMRFRSNHYEKLY